MRIAFFLLLASLSAALSAQDPADIFHKTVDLDSIDEVSFNVYQYDNYTVKEWPGDDILVETRVVINNGQRHILDFFLKEKRWELKPKVNGNQLLLKSYDMQRRLVQGTDGLTSETVDIVVYMPDNFAASGEVYRRQ